MNRLFNRSLCITESLEDLLVKNLNKRIQFRLWNTKQASWFGVLCPNLEQLDSISCLQEKWRMLQGKWNCFRRNWNCICSFISTQCLYMMMLYATGQRQFRIFFKISRWQHLTGRGSKPNWKFMGNCQKKKKVVEKLQLPKNWEKLLMKSVKKEISLDSCSNLILTIY